MTKEELLAMLKEKDVKAALKGTDLDAEDIFQEIEVTDTDTPESIAKKFNAQLKKVVGHFEGKIEKVKADAVNEALAPTRHAKQQEILDFQKANPGMSNAEVIAIMDPLYQSGKSLKEAYMIACKSLELDPTTGKKAGEETDEQKAAREAEEAKAGKKKEDAPKKSLKASDIPDDEGGGAGSGEKTKAKSLAEIIAANANVQDAEVGNPFKDE